MPETSRPMCQLVAWCALEPHDPDEQPCSLIRPRTDRLDPAAVDRFVAGVAAAVQKAGISVKLALAQQPAVGGTMQDPTTPAHPDEPAVDVNWWITGIRKANDTADEYMALAIELGDLIGRYRALKSRQVESPEDGDPIAPSLLRSSMVKLDATEHLVRLERAQVAFMGYAGAWQLQAGAWDAQCKEDLAHEEKLRREEPYVSRLEENGLTFTANTPPAAEAVRTCRVCGCTDLRACEGGCGWAEADLCTRCAEKALPVAAEEPARDVHDDRD